MIIARVTPICSASLSIPRCSCGVHVATSLANSSQLRRSPSRSIRYRISKMPSTSSSRTCIFVSCCVGLYCKAELERSCRTSLSASHTVNHQFPIELLQPNTMHTRIFISLSTAALFFISLTLATPLEEARAAAAHPNPDANQLLRAIYPRQIAPSSYTTARTANTEFAPPQTISPTSTTPATPITSRVSNNEIVPSSNTGPAPPLITTDSRTANTQAVGPFTVSSGKAAPTGVDEGGRGMGG
ncbi:hypothetical protein BU26DRAFT_603354 [Trematosphaeria pertusa]|uniref:Uncharacterized protein n=1 Tax=Trematosphaeria pertusa TaxID=390896 RepID=A0A6A6IMW9_9PLEO|nr:uncharacterized protein BU26DRAFT_603354 [Trematosphaeria pertusa]KAF2250823.1 hypothetical protein BU26DRAFT_603354 [Trematosphaeria pertusa]